MSNEDLKAKIYDFGALGYSIKRMASILSISIDDMQEKMNNQEGEWYKSGSDIYEYHVDKKLMEMSMAGDIKALAEMKKRKSQRR